MPIITCPRCRESFQVGQRRSKAVKWDTIRWLSWDSMVDHLIRHLNGG